MSYVEEIDKLQARLERQRAAETRVLDGLAREAHEARQALYACEAERDEARAALGRVRALAAEATAKGEALQQSAPELRVAGIAYRGMGERILAAIDGPQS